MIVRKSRFSEYENYFQVIQCHAEIQIYVTEEDLTGCYFVHEVSFFFSLQLILPFSFPVAFRFQCKWVVAETLRGEFCFVVPMPAVKGRKKKVEKRECENCYNLVHDFLETFPQVWNAQSVLWLIRGRCFSLAEFLEIVIDALVKQ